MSENNYAKFILNSDYPMPAQASEVVGSVFVPVDTSTVPTHTINTDVQVGASANIHRLAVKCSRDNKIYPSSGQGAMFYFDDVEFVAYIRSLGNGIVRCSVRINKGLSNSIEKTTASTTFQFYISSFIVP